MLCPNRSPETTITIIAIRATVRVVMIIAAAFRKERQFCYCIELCVCFAADILAPIRSQVLGALAAVTPQRAHCICDVATCESRISAMRGFTVNSLLGKLE